MKYALVTGGSRGIGRAVCLELSKLGYHILINYHSNESAAQETLNLLKQQNGEGSLLQFDVANNAQSQEVLEGWLAKEDGRCVEVIVNNAGIRKDNLLVWMEAAEWQSVLDTHLGGFYNVTKCLLKAMIRNKYGRIINIVSLSGIKGVPGQTNYSAAKAGVIGASKALAQETGRKNITVNCVAPGFIKTDMIEDVDEAAFKTAIPLRRFGTPEEVAAVVGFLASPQASYITGEVISVNGGMYT
jgi:3-oxoacyl-[acyl-carrier protein] reductase